ncbi:RNA polymerase sigma factor [Cohnella boryungensis]|uniref:RNA polymerase sigma factor n=1 Tax=Cohnella boryungensis TaxID=768479 RepID=A0ABV8SGD2_9BACL
MNANAAYETWMTPQLPDLKKYCYYLTGSKWDAEDLLQDTLLKSFVFFLQTEPYVEMKPFFFRIAKNLWIDDCRKRKRRGQAVSEAPNATYRDKDYAEIRGSLEWLADRLPSRSIEIWLLFNYFGYTMQEVADDLGCTVPAVKSVLFRTRELLRGRRELGMNRSVIRLEVERWTRAIMLDRPQAALSEG